MLQAGQHLDFSQHLAHNNERDQPVAMSPFLKGVGVTQTAHLHAIVL